MGDNSTSTSPTQVTSGCYIDHALYMKIESVSEDATSTAGSLSEWWVYEPTSPSKSRRYSRNRTIKNGTPALLIKPLSKSLTQDCAIEGIKGMCDGKIPQMPDDPGDNDLFVDLCRDEDGKLSRDEDGRPHCRYYFVNHSKRCIYWAEEVTLDYELSLLLHTNKEPDTYNYVVESLLDAMADVVVSDGSVLEYTYEELQKRLEVAQAGKDFKSSSWHIGRFMLEISYGRLGNYYGARCARLSGSQSVLEENEPKNCSIFLNAMSPLLFFIPHVQLHRLETLGTTVDGTVLVTRQWNKLFDQLQGEWTQTILIQFLYFRNRNLWIPTALRNKLRAMYPSLLVFLASFLESYIYGENESELKITRMKHLLVVWSFPQALVTWSFGSGRDLLRSGRDLLESWVDDITEMVDWMKHRKQKLMDGGV
ncbi:hypothetical protein AGABI2DRAFT_143989 [Agaricus bisporus var. bisporus H97]|uniref:hypothetical protein n=1 Tax=Agaricus bisporus var. bisporus (strain H97 / ATCC MYA-4626 / FGSC 10389) TaxID=936046 RepID=UPI00029F71CC|nr:hypothetical protein AGABI2DRAFT_143989 [Agaricus bisporus var. bisporus H97]EKV45565.1 hypothetical protein AGABI2DRAFT_143989 [Agaricus bisporus var. bisporus H97]